MKKRWDIFCKVVDNYGDIGVCWRLAKQLQTEHGLQVRLWVDAINVAKQIVPELDISKNVQAVENVTIQQWQVDSVFEGAADVVIEAFACNLPEAYLALMRADNVWVNLEYLSAEKWVEDFHTKNSPFASANLTRHFYFPGFTPATGGLVREHDLIARRDAFWRSQAARVIFWQKLGVTQNVALTISMFCYPNAPLEALFNGLSWGLKNTIVLAPENDCLQQFASFFGKKNLSAGDKVSIGKFSLQVLPFLSQDDYDKLLWACDINFVRGEDSWIRGVWAGKPFIWQPYPQQENAHIIKLDAFLDAFYGDSDVLNLAKAVCRAWAIGDFNQDSWQHYIENFPALARVTLQQTNRLAEQADLASKLVIFCNNL